MKYNCQILNTSKAIIELIPENEVEKSLLSKMDEDNPNDFTLHYHYEKGIKSINNYAELLFVEYQKFPTVAIITYDIAKGIGG